MSTMPLTRHVQSSVPNLHIPNPILPQLSRLFLATPSFHLHGPNSPFSYTPRQFHQKILLGYSSRGIQILTTSHSLPNSGYEPQTSPHKTSFYAPSSAPTNVSKGQATCPSAPHFQAKPRAL